jgi:hypothetical protein
MPVAVVFLLDFTGFVPADPVEDGTGADRDATWQGRFALSLLIAKVKFFGMPIGLAISNDALVSDALRTVQSIPAA